jgi:DNA (cytosine-5)-methyltransferase 1
LPDNRIVVPSINDVERLQGFERDWTLPATEVAKKGHRWKLVGNAVSVEAAAWAGEKLRNMESGLSLDYPNHTRPFDQHKSWPHAAFGGPGMERLEVIVSTWPVARKATDLISILDKPYQLLSTKAISGFLKRLEEGSLHYSEEFYDACVRQRDNINVDLRTA